MTKIDFSELPKTWPSFSSQALLFRLPLTFTIISIIFALVWGLLMYQKDPTLSVVGAVISLCIAIFSAFMIRPAMNRDTRSINDNNAKLFDIYALFAQSNGWESRNVTDQIPEEVLDAYIRLRFYTNIATRKSDYKKYIQKAQDISGNVQNKVFHLYYLYETPRFILRTAAVNKYSGQAPSGLLKINDEQVRYVVTGTLLDYEMKDFFTKQLGYTE